ncbi:hypothetical protein FQA47_006389 [Oryzias melastigma]|uniref:Uncharacterized protein n=1 Tax=Oryzias melastigma TaxID=30732 RepID=A0A834CEL2_ORYME|nr:hypothetical protein FQA47_006389 [Oryzias melastigma]
MPPPSLPLAPPSLKCIKCQHGHFIGAGGLLPTPPLPGTLFVGGDCDHSILLPIGHPAASFHRDCNPIGCQTAAGRHGNPGQPPCVRACRAGGGGAGVGGVYRRPSLCFSVQCFCLPVPEGEGAEPRFNRNIRLHRSQIEVTDPTAPELRFPEGHAAT